VRIPAGTVIRDRDNRVVTEVNLTAVPVNRPPFPIPELDVPVYFTVQPGGAWLQGVDAQSFKGARIFYPNFKKTLPGTKGLFFNYDPLEKEWYVYGHGTISPDGLQAVPDPGVTIYEFTGAMFTDGPAAPPAGPKPCSSDCCIFVGSPPQGSGDSGGTGDGGGGGGGGGSGDGDGGDGEGSWEKVVLNDKPGCEGVGDPVSASTGYFIHSERDLYLTDVIPIDLTRTYRSQDNSKRSFGLGWSTAYDMILSSENYFQEVDLILPSGGRIHFVRVSPGTGFVDAIFESVGIGKWFRARLERNNVRQGWDLILRDGTRWYFPQYQPVSEITNVNGNTLIVTRRDNNGTTGPIKRIQSPNGRYVEFTLDGSGRIAEAKDNIGRTFTYTYDASGRLTKATDPMSGERNYTYDANHRLLTVKDPRSIVGITNEYDANGRIFRQTLADSNTLQYAYTITSGKVSRTDVTDQRGKVRRIEFGTDGYITKSTSAYGTADAQETNFTVNSLGQITAKTDPLGRTTAYTYDGWGNRLTVTRLYGTANAVTTTFTYTSGGKRLATVTDPLNHTTTFTYDAWGRLATVTDPLSQSVTFTRDSQGRKLTVTDALSHTWTYSYSGADLATVTDPLSRTTQFFSDASGRLMAVKDPSGSSRTVEYDVLNRLKKAIDPLIGAAEFSYDANGNLTSHKDQNNNTTTYSYNDLSLRTGKTDALTRAESYAYGVNGRVSRITDRKSQVTGVTYDNLNRVSQVGFGATVSNPTNYTSTIDYTYDAGNRVTQMVDSVGGTITRAYDDLNRLTQEQTPDGTISYTYDSAGRRATMTVTGQSVVSYTWDNANRLTQIAQGSDTIVFTHDNANRRTKTTLANGVEIAYGYDSSNQLTSIAYSKTGTPIGDLVYTYDSAGRRTKVSGSLARVDLPTAVASASHNANNQLTSWAGNTYDYDLNGNLTSDGTSTYSWDARDQLSSIAGGAAASFGYDAVGRRRTKTVSSTQTGFVFDGATFVQELTGSSVKANLIAGGIDEVFLRREGSTTRHPITDALGSIIALTSNSGTLATEYSFEPYGKTSTTGGADSNTQSFTGREDDGTGLLYYRARYYMPGCGRFISEDPIGTAGGINLYRYVGSSPMNLSDPFGLRPLSNCEKDNLSDFIPKEDLDNANLRDGDPPKWLRKDKDAVTIGNDIRTKKKFDESNAGDLGLLGHELVHVGQFRNGMTVGDYIWESMKNGTGTDNKFENPAYEKQREIGKALTQKHGSGPICK
jgi:RHS repeat-associated protein